MQFYSECRDCDILNVRVIGNKSLASKFQLGKLEHIQTKKEKVFLVSI